MKPVIGCRRFLLLFASVGFLSGGTYAQITREKAYLPAIENAARLVTELQIKSTIPGIAIAVGTGKKILWAEGFGKADIENNVPVTMNSKFRIGSLSKCLTAMAIGKLYQEGKLLLDTPIQTYVPQFPHKQYAITVRQLAGHTAGIRHYRFGDHQRPARYHSVQEAMVTFENDPLLFEPNTGYAYSTYGYTLISAAIEGASGRHFLSYMQQEVFSPLQMMGTIGDFKDSLIADRVNFYEDYGHGNVNALPVDNSYKWAGGGYLSTTPDLVRLGQALLNPSILTKKTVQLLFSPQRLNNGDTIICGIAWRIEKDKEGRRIIHHGGAIAGGRSFILLYPDHDLVVAICANKLMGVNIDKNEMEAIAGYFLARPGK